MHLGLVTERMITAGLQAGNSIIDSRNSPRSGCPGVHGLFVIVVGSVVTSAAFAAIAAGMRIVCLPGGVIPR
jgi:hypothetical protein